MEIDTGASTSLVNNKTFSKLFGNANKMTSTSSKICTYTGEVVSPIGEVKLEFIYDNQKTVTSVIIMEGNYSNLLGRDILHKIKLNWEELFNHNNRKENVNFVDDVNLNNIISRYKRVFDKELGTLKNVEVSLKIKADAIPKFCRARPIPYALKDRVEKELQHLVTEGILEPISHSEWAAPIVPVIKPDNNVHICGDYKQTINRASNCDKHPVPRTEDLFALLGEGEKFTKLDLSHAYQQLLLNPASCSYLTINTHKGLFQPTQLQFGVNSASGIFQRETENLLKYAPFV